MAPGAFLQHRGSPWLATRAWLTERFSVLLTCGTLYEASCVLVGFVYIEIAFFNIFQGAEWPLMPQCLASSLNSMIQSNPEFLRVTKWLIELFDVIFVSY